MLQFIAILGISTLLSVAAYKIQHGEIQENINLLQDTAIENSETTKMSYLLID